MNPKITTPAEFANNRKTADDARRNARFRHLGCYRERIEAALAIAQTHEKPFPLEIPAMRDGIPLDVIEEVCAEYRKAGWLVTTRGRVMFNGFEPSAAEPKQLCPVCTQPAHSHDCR